MNSIRNTFNKFFSKVEPIPAGTYPYQAPPDAPFPYRLHLRIEPDGTGILIVNASTVLHLNQTAAEYAFHLVRGTPEDEIARAFASRYRVSKSQALDDYHDLSERIHTLVNTPDLDPVSYLGFDRAQPYSGQVTVPYRLDCALTYRLAPGSPPEAAPIERVKRELDTQEWKAIIDKAWAAGIPHLIFTGGEPTLREDLIELIRFAEDRGQVTGLISDGLRLADPDYLEPLLQSGLDHLMMVFNTANEQAWQALERIIPADLFTAVHLTVTPDNLPQMSAVLEKLFDQGVQTISLSASDLASRQALPSLHDMAADIGLSLVWDLPVPYSASHPISVEVEEDEGTAEGAGQAWLYVEPDGDVLPAQGVNRVLGNMLTDDWGVIKENR